MKNQVIIIGLGNIGMEYDYDLPNTFIQSHSRAVFLNEKMDLVAGIDRREKAREKFAVKYNEKTYKNVSEILNSDTFFDTVIVATQTEEIGFIFDLVSQDSRVKNLILEKPVTHNIDDFSAMLEFVKKREIKCAVNYFRPSLPEFFALKSRIMHSKLGDIIGGHFYYSKGILHNGSHFVNLIQFLFPGHQIFVEPTSGATPSVYEKDIDIDFQISLNGTPINVKYVDAKFFNIFAGELHFENALVSINDSGAEIKIRTVLKNNVGARELGSSSLLNNSSETYQKFFLDDFIRYCQGGPSNICTLDQAADTIGLIHPLLRPQ